MRYTICYTQRRNSTFYFRLRVPKSCRGLTSQTEISASLRTDSPSIACAMVASKLPLIQQLKRMNDKNTTHNELRDLFSELTDFSSIDEKGRRCESDKEFVGASALVDMLRDSLSEGGGKSGIGDYLKTQPDASDAAAQRDFEWLALQLLEARRERMVSGRSREFKRLSSIAKETLEELTGCEPAPAPASAPAAPALTLKDAWDGFVKSRKWNAGVLRDNTRSYEFLVAKWGEDLDVNAIDRRKVNEVLKDYANMPKGNLKPYNKMTVAERASVPWDDIEEEDTIASKTVKELLKLLQAFLSAYLTNEQEVFKVAPTANVKVEVEKNRYGIYTDSELKRFEQAALAEETPWKKWGLLLGIYSGMRAGEVAKVLADGPKVSEGIHYFRMVNGKTPAATRNIPIHSRLIELGILDAGVVKFPRDKALTDYTNALRDKLGIAPRDVNDNRRVYHSFRHSFITRVRHKGGVDVVVKRLVGHNLGGGITDNYTHEASLAELKECVEKMVF